MSSNVDWDIHILPTFEIFWNNNFFCILIGWLMFHRLFGWNRVERRIVNSP